MKTFLALLISSTVVYGQNFPSFLQRVELAPEASRMALVDSFMSAVPQFPLIEANTSAHFIYRGSATSASVPGDANNWSTTAFPMTRLSTTDLWYHSGTFESDARLDYKFLLNGANWILDPRNPYTVSGGFGPNSELRMPGYVPAPEIQYYQGIPHGTLRDTSFFSTNLGNARTIRIYAPPDYESSTDSFGLMLFHDGLEYVTLAQANNVIDYLISQNRIRPIIGVFVPPVNRTAEYAGNQMNQFTNFIVNELMPYVDARYRTRRNPSSRATLGASNGGNIALWLAYTNSNIFGNVAAQSSNIISSIATGFQNSPRLNLTFYLDLGTYDIPQLIPLVRAFIPILQSKGYLYRYNEYHEGHSWGNWRAHVDNALELFFPPIQTGTREQDFPEELLLHQNSPNPFNPETTIRFSIPNATRVQLDVFDILGSKIRMLVSDVLERGGHSVIWNGLNDSGLRVASGMYLYRLHAGNSMQTRKLLLLE